MRVRLLRWSDPNVWDVTLRAESFLKRGSVWARLGQKLSGSRQGIVSHGRQDSFVVAKTEREGNHGQSCKSSPTWKDDLTAFSWFLSGGSFCRGDTTVSSSNPNSQTQSSPCTISRERRARLFFSSSFPNSEDGHWRRLSAIYSLQANCPASVPPSDSCCPDQTPNVPNVLTLLFHQKRMTQNHNQIKNPCLKV